MLTRNMDFDRIPSHVFKLSLEDIPPDHKSRLNIFDLVLMRITTNNNSKTIASIVDKINKTIILDGKNNQKDPIDLDYDNPEAVRLHTRCNYQFHTFEVAKCLIDQTKKLPLVMSNKEINQIKQIYNFIESELNRK